MRIKSYRYVTLTLCTFEYLILFIFISDFSNNSISSVQSLPFGLPISTALTILASIVKMKIILTKTLLGLREMGYMRFKRSIEDIKNSDLDTMIGQNQNETISEAWINLQMEIERNLTFSLESCIQSIVQGKDPVHIWGRITEAELKKNSTGGSTDLQVEYSSDISSLLGIMTGDKQACLILQQEIENTNRAKKEKLNT